MRLLGSESIPGGVEKTWSHIGHDNREKITVETTLDVAPLLKRNAEERSASSGFHKGDLHKVAEFDGVTLDAFARKNGITFSELLLGRSERAQRALNDLLNGREFTAFRTKPGRVDVKRGIR